MKLQVFLCLAAFLAVGCATVIVDDLISHPITWYRYCKDEPGKATIKLIALTNCSTLATCEIRTEEQTRILLTFDAGANYSSLDYVLSLRELNGNRSYFEVAGNGFETVEEGNEYSIGINFILSSSIPRNDYNLRLHRFVGSETELCVQFEIYVRNDSPTTLPPSTTTTEEPSTEALTQVSTAVTLPANRTETPELPTDAATTNVSEITTSVPETTPTNASNATTPVDSGITTTDVSISTTASYSEATTSAPNATTTSVSEITTTSDSETTTTISNTTTTVAPETTPELTTIDPVTAAPTSNTTITTTTTANPSPGYNCTSPGMFPDPVSCSIFHVCQLFPNGTIWDQQLECPANLVYCPRIDQCEFEPLCPCDRPFFN